MKDIYWYLHTGFSGCTHSGVIKVPDAATDDEIEAIAKDEAFNNISWGWSDKIPEDETPNTEVTSTFDAIEANQKAIAGARFFEGDMLERTRLYFRSSLTWASNALEGNSFDKAEVKMLLEDGVTTGGKPLRDAFETVGHGEAYDSMFALREKRSLTEQDILTMHHRFYWLIDRQNAGTYRDRQVRITGSQYPTAKPENIRGEMAALLEWADTQREKIHPVEFAALLHKRFVFIHPFIDGNGRVARLLMNAALIQDGYLPAIIPPAKRRRYIDALETAHTDDKPFIDFIASQVLESQQLMMRLLIIQPEPDKTIE